MLLLDTNAFIWFVGDEDTLSEEIRAEIETNEHVCVSTLSLGRLSEGGFYDPFCRVISILRCSKRIFQVNLLRRHGDTYLPG